MAGKIGTESCAARAQSKFEKPSSPSSSEASNVISPASAREGFKTEDKAQDIKLALSAAEVLLGPIVDGLVKDETTGLLKAVEDQLVQTFPKTKVEGRLMTLKTKARLPTEIPRPVPNHHETASKPPHKSNFYQPRYAASKIPRRVPSSSRPLSFDSNKSITKQQTVLPARLAEDSFLKQIRPKLTRTSTPYDEYKSPIQKEIAANKRRLQRMNAGHFTDTSEQLLDDFEFGLKRPI